MCLNLNSFAADKLVNDFLSSATFHHSHVMANHYLHGDRAIAIKFVDFALRQGNQFKKLTFRILTSCSFFSFNLIDVGMVQFFDFVLRQFKKLALRILTSCSFFSFQSHRCRYGQFFDFVLMQFKNLALRILTSCSYVSFQSHRCRYLGRKVLGYRVPRYIKGE